MKSVDQVSRGIADFYDTEIRSSLPGWKAIAYGVAVGRLAANAPQIIGTHAATLEMLGILRDGMVDVEGLAAELKNQMQRGGGEMKVELMGDSFTFLPADVDALMRCIERA